MGDIAIGDESGLVSGRPHAPHEELELPQLAPAALPTRSSFDGCSTAPLPLRRLLRRSLLLLLLRPPPPPPPPLPPPMPPPPPPPMPPLQPPKPPPPPQPPPRPTPPPPTTHGTSGGALTEGGRRAPARWPAGAAGWGRHPVDEDERALRKERLQAASVEEVEEERSVPQAVEADLRESRVAAAAEGEPAREESEIDRSESRARESASESVEEAHEGWWWVAVEEEREPWKRSGGGSGEQVESESSSRLVEVRCSCRPCSCKSVAGAAAVAVAGRGAAEWGVLLLVAGLPSGEGGEHGGDVRSDEEAPVQQMAQEVATAAAAAAEAGAEEEAGAVSDEEALVQLMGRKAAAAAAAAGEAAVAAAGAAGPKPGLCVATVAGKEVSETGLRFDLRAAAGAVREISEIDATDDSRDAIDDSVSSRDATDDASEPRGGCEDEDELRHERSRDERRVVLVMLLASPPAGRLANRAGPRMSLRRRGERPPLGRRGSPPRLSNTELRMSEAVQVKEVLRLCSECLTVRSVMGCCTSGRDERRLASGDTSTCCSAAGDGMGGGAAWT